MRFTNEATRKKMTEFPQKLNFLSWSIQVLVKKVKQFVRKYYITGVIDLGNKLYDVEKFLDFVLYPALLKIVVS